MKIILVAIYPSVLDKVLFDKFVSYLSNEYPGVDPILCSENINQHDAATIESINKLIGQINANLHKYPLAKVVVLQDNASTNANIILSLFIERFRADCLQGLDFLPLRVNIAPNLNTLIPGAMNIDELFDNVSGKLKIMPRYPDSTAIAFNERWLFVADVTRQFALWAEQKSKITLVRLDKAASIADMIPLRRIHTSAHTISAGRGYLDLERLAPQDWDIRLHSIVKHTTAYNGIVHLHLTGPFPASLNYSKFATLIKRLTAEGYGVSISSAHKASTQILNAKLSNNPMVTVNSIHGLTAMEAARNATNSIYTLQDQLQLDGKHLPVKQNSLLFSQTSKTSLHAAELLALVWVIYNTYKILKKYSASSPRYQKFKYKSK